MLVLYFILLRYEIAFIPNTGPFIAPKLHKLNARARCLELIISLTVPGALTIVALPKNPINTRLARTAAKLGARATGKINNVNRLLVSI